MLANYYSPQVSSFSLASARQGLIKVKAGSHKAKSML
jgi:hypothetical protein